MGPDVAADEDIHDVIPHLELTCIKPDFNIKDAFKLVGFFYNSLNFSAS